MPHLLTSLIDLCRFRRGPEDVPYAPRALIALLIAAGTLQVAFNLHNGARPGLVAAAVAGSLAVVGGVFVLLRSRDKSARFVQTLTALAAVYLVFGIVTDALALFLPLRALREEILQHPGHPPALTGANVLVLMAVFALGVWQLCVWIRILRRALEVSLAGAVLGFLLLLLVDWVVTGLAAAAIGAA
ncbi:MAG: hypothetical protein EPN38_02370 [Rhodanobacteraceae bacterium]|nr:MAG: hypothetical protein EPN38_02370 [Rhodanobacteraceae bacterium]